MSYINNPSSGTGPPGPTGPQGSQGVPGEPGEPGEDGSLGPQGPSGSPGATGTPGATGSIGPIGPPGNDGDEIVDPPFFFVDVLQFLYRYGRAGAANNALISTNDDGTITGSGASIKGLILVANLAADASGFITLKAGAIQLISDDGVSTPVLALVAPDTGFASRFSPAPGMGSNLSYLLPSVIVSQGVLQTDAFGNLRWVPQTAIPVGPPGEDGEDGSIGPPGLTGATGATGATGTQGQTGAPGQAGADGEDGLRGPPGQPGATGPQGIPGAARVTDSDEDIAPLYVIPPFTPLEAVFLGRKHQFGNIGQDTTVTVGQGGGSTEAASLVLNGGSSALGNVAQLVLKTNGTTTASLVSGPFGITLYNYFASMQFFDLLTNPSQVRFSILSVGTAGCIVTVGGAGAGSDAATLAIDCGSTGTTAPSLLLRRAGTSKVVLTHDGTDAFLDYVGNLKFRSSIAGTAKFILDTNGKVSQYNNIATVSNGVPSILGTVDLTAQAAALTTAALYTPVTAGLFRVTFAITLTRAATTSSIVGAGVNLNYTTGDGATAVVQNVPMRIKTSTTATVDIGDASNTIGTTLIGDVAVYAGTVAMTYDIGYTSVGGTTMQYAVRIRVEAL